MDGPVTPCRPTLRAAWTLAALLAAAPVAHTATAQATGRVVAEQAMASASGVRAFVRVTDADGRAVRPDSAALAPMLDGRRAALVTVTAARAAPLGVVFVVCLDRAQPPAEVSETIAAFVAFADGLTATGDRAAIVTCGDRARIVRPWSAPADVRRALDGLRATDDEADEAEALRLAATLPGAGLRRIALVRTDGRHLDPATEADVSAAGLPVFPIARPGTPDALPLVTLARATGGAPLDGAPGPALAALRERLAASWQLDLAAPGIRAAGDTAATAAPTWFSVRVGTVTSSRVRIVRAPAVPAAAPAAPTDAADDGGSNVLLWLTLGALAIAAAAGWVFFGARIRERIQHSTAAPPTVDDGALGDDVAPESAPSPSPHLASPPLAPMLVDVPPQAPRVRLVGADGQVVGVAVLDLPRIVGRGEEADIRLRDAAVSARHASLSYDGERIHIRDLGSTNGMAVRGADTREAVLAHGDTFVLGETPLTLVVEGAAPGGAPRARPPDPSLTLDLRLVSTMPLVISIAQHIGTRAEQQDAARVREHVPGFPDGTVGVVVADGMGGHAGGAAASRIAADVFTGALARTAHAEPAADVLHRATGEAGREVHAAARAAGVEDDMGTTLVAAIVEPERFAWMSVGDSGVYVVRSGDIEKLNTPHTLGTRLDRAVAEGRVTAEDAASNRQRHALTSFLGQARLTEIDGAVEPVLLAVGDRLILCSDGLFGTLTDDEMTAVLAAVVPEHAAQALVDAVLSRGRERQDNVTALVVTRTPALPAAPPPPSGASPAVAAPPSARPPAWRPLVWIGVLVAVAAVAFWLWPRLRPAPVPVAADTLAVPRADSLAARDTTARDTLARDTTALPAPSAPLPTAPGPAAPPRDTARVVPRSAPPTGLVPQSAVIVRPPSRRVVGVRP